MKVIIGLFLLFVVSPYVKAESVNSARLVSSILCPLLLCDDSKEFFFEDSLSSAYRPDFGLSRQVALAELSPREAAVYGSNSYPIFVRNESQSANLSDVSTSWKGAGKYGYLFTRQGSMDELEQMQAATPGLLAVHYESPADPQGPYNSPWARNGSGGIFTHGQLFLKLGNVTTGGDIANPPTQYNQADFPQWIGHVIPTEPATLKSNQSALLHPDTNEPVCRQQSHVYHANQCSLTYELRENIDKNWFKSVCRKEGQNPYCGAFIWTPNTDQSTFADEASNPVTGFTNAERVKITAVDYVNNTLTVSRVRVPGGNKIFGSSAADGSSFPRLAGDKVMLIPPGQGSVPFLNDAMNMHPAFGFEDANGNTYFEAMRLFYRNNLNRNDRDGTRHKVTLDASASDVTEEYHPSSDSLRIDFDGDGKEDDGIIGGRNRWKEAHELGTARYTGLAHGGGGTGESVLNNMAFQQTEHVSESGHEEDDQLQRFYDMGGNILRTLYLKYYASHAHYNACVTKHSTRAFNHSGSATSNDAFYTKMGLCLLALTNMAPRNFDNANPEHKDNWWTIGAIDLASNSAIRNSPNAQNQIIENRGWGGRPISPLMNISGVDLDGLVADYEWDFSTDITSDWEIAGREKDGSILYDAVGKRMIVRDYFKGFSLGRVHVRPKQTVIAPNDIGKDIIVRYHIGSNSHGEIVQQLGKVGSKRVEKKIYLNPDMPVFYETAFRITASDFTSSSNFTQKLKLALSRLNDSNTSAPELHIYKIQIFKRANINNALWAREFERMVAICNGTDTPHTIDLEPGKRLLFPVMEVTPSQLPSWAESGEIFDADNPLVLPKHTCGVLVKG